MSFETKEEEKKQSKEEMIYIPLLQSNWRKKKAEREGRVEKEKREESKRK
jgi:hypothetical protein